MDMTYDMISNDVKSEEELQDKKEKYRKWKGSIDMCKTMEEWARGTERRGEKVLLE